MVSEILSITEQNHRLNIAMVTLTILGFILFSTLHWIQSRRTARLTKQVRNMEKTFVAYLKKLDEKNEGLYRENKKLKKQNTNTARG